MKTNTYEKQIIKCPYCYGEMTEYAVDSDRKIFSWLCIDCGAVFSENDYKTLTSHTCGFCGEELIDFTREICESCERILSKENETFYIIADKKSKKRIFCSDGRPSPVFKNVNKAISFLNKKLVKKKEVVIIEI